MTLDDKQKQKLLRLAKIADKGEVGIADELNILDDKIDTVDEKATEALNREVKDGEKGDTGEPGRNPMTVSKTAPINPEIGDLWYQP